MNDILSLRCRASIVWVRDAEQTLLVDRDLGHCWTLCGREAVIWDWLAAGDSSERAAELLAVMLSLSAEEAARHLERTLRGWLEAGILEPGEP